MRPARLALVVAVALAARGADARAQDAGAGTVYIDPADLADAPEVTAAASPSEVVLGTRFVLIVTAAYDDGVTVNLPSSLDLGPAFEERARRPTEKTRSDGKKIREWQVEVLAWELGDVTVPPVQVTFVRGGVAGAVVTNEVPIRVVGTLGDLADTTAPRALAPPLDLWKRTWVWVIALAAAVVAVIALAAWLRWRRRRAAPIAAAAPAVRASGLFRRRLGAPAEEALLRLEQIDKGGMLARDRRLAYTEMVAVMQTFLARQLGGDVEDVTGGELRAWLAGAPVAGATRLELSRWLDECELVKFGGVRPDVDEGRAQLAAGRDLVIAIATPAAAPLEPAEAARA